MSSFINQFKIFIKQNVIVLVRVSIAEQNEIWFLNYAEVQSRLVVWKISWEAYLNVMSQGSLATSTLHSDHSPRSLTAGGRGQDRRNQGLLRNLSIAWPITSTHILLAVTWFYHQPHPTAQDFNFVVNLCLREKLLLRSITAHIPPIFFFNITM